MIAVNSLQLNLLWVAINRQILLLKKSQKNIKTLISINIVFRLHNIHCLIGYSITIALHLLWREQLTLLLSLYHR